MISIRVCKLSDILKKIIAILIMFIFFVVLYSFIIKFLTSQESKFIYFSISKNIGIAESTSFCEKLIKKSLPIEIVKNIKKEDELISNKNEIKKEVQIDSKPQSNYNTLFIQPPYLLDCIQLPNGKYQIGSVVINDYTKKDINFSELEKSLFTKIREDCRILLYHTHTSESYANTKDTSSTYHTENNESNVVKVGEVLQQELNKYGIYARHDISKHDTPSYNGAYKSSLKTVENILKNESYDIIIDIHRDALASNSAYRPTAEVNGETVAKLMFVVGTNTAGLKHNNWIENLKFAVAFQQRANELFPGLFRDLHLSTSRYNQHTSDKSIILEVGATGNTIEEATLAMKYFAMVLNAMKSM